MACESRFFNISAIIAGIAFLLGIIGACTPVYTQSIIPESTPDLRVASSLSDGGVSRVTYLDHEQCIVGSSRPSICASWGYKCDAMEHMFQASLGFVVIALIGIGLAFVVSLVRSVRLGTGERWWSVDAVVLGSFVIAWASLLVAFPLVISLYTQQICDALKAQHDQGGSAIGPSGILLWVSWMMCMVGAGREISNFRNSEYQTDAEAAAEEDSRHSHSHHHRSSRHRHDSNNSYGAAE